MTNSRCSSTASSSPSQPGSPLATAMAPQHAVPCPWSSSAWQTPLPQHKHVPTATEVTLSLALCALLVSERWLLGIFGNRPMGYVSPTANSPCFSPF